MTGRRRGCQGVFHRTPPPLPGRSRACHADHVSDPESLQRQVARLSNQAAQTSGVLRLLDADLSDVRLILKAHTRSLQALHDTQAEHGHALRELAAVTAGLVVDVSRLRTELTEVRAELKSDIAEVRAELKADVAEVRAELAEVRAELKADVAEVRAELAEVRAELKADIAEVRAELGEVRAELREVSLVVHEILRRLPAAPA